LLPTELRDLEHAFREYLASTPKAKAQERVFREREDLCFLRKPLFFFIIFLTVFSGFAQCIELEKTGGEKNILQNSNLYFP
jgi:hypothetical protein